MIEHSGNFPVDEAELTRLLSDLVSIQSVNPAYQGGTGEGEVAAYIQDRLREWEIPFQLQEVFPNRKNVVAEVTGSEPGKRLLFEAHMDTVSVTGMEIEPFEPRVENGLLYGRGSCDTKAGLAAMLYALKAARAQGPPPVSIVLAATVDEEYAFSGVTHLVASGMQAAAAVVSEPTGLDIIIAHKGCLRWRLTTRGKAAHSSKVHLGVNAISKMADVIRALDTRLVSDYRDRSHPLLGNPTFNIGLIEGGVQVNTVPDQCSIQIDRRMLPGETRDSVWGEFQEVLDSLVSSNSDLQVRMEEPMLEDYPLETDADAEVVQLARQACRDTLGDATIAGVPYGTDASKLSRAGIPSIVLGPGNIDQAHSAVEFVPLKEVFQAAEIYSRMIFNF